MSKVYELRQDTENYANFIEQRDKYENSFAYSYYFWKHIDIDNYKPIDFKLYSSDNGSKNYKTDISISTGGLMILSENAINIFKDIVNKNGQLIFIKTESKRKKFFGFFPNKAVYDASIINLDKSVWRQAERGKIINKLVLNNKCPLNDYLFTLEDGCMNIYVTDKFKDLVEKHDLKGFDFSREIAIID